MSPPGRSPAESADSRARLRASLRGNAADLLAYFERRVSPREDAADLLGEAMLQAWRRYDSLPADSLERQRMWLFKIAANVLANHRRSVNRRLALAARLRQRLTPVDRMTVEDSSEALAIRDAVTRLPSDQRDLVMLVHWDSFTLTEAAEILGVNPSTARGRYSEARSALKEALSDRVEC